ncbi:hypothetical protein [Lederbergia lenta]|uniref:hypothetical protein n=1 Tax=Lederbergia lenta TaxID=1467 RepID=UPI00203BEC95|nr:hypothetical protein [Lederbergia lenta]MCM3109983.1 hypothetical protein [Lederbergia lenta]
MPNNFVSDWSNVIKNTKTEVLRIYRKDDIDRSIPFIFNGWTKDFKTREDMISIYTKKAENNYGEYLSYVMNRTTFDENFEEVVEEI